MVIPELEALLAAEQEEESALQACLAFARGVRRPSNRLRGQLICQLSPPNRDTLPPSHLRRMRC